MVDWWVIVLAYVISLNFGVSLNNSDRGLLHIQADVSLLSPLIDRNAAHVYLSNSSSCKYSSKASTSTRRRMSWLMILSYAALLVLPLPAGELPLPLDAAILARARVILQRNMILF